MLLHTSQGVQTCAIVTSNPITCSFQRVQGVQSAAVLQVVAAITLHCFTSFRHSPHKLGIAGYPSASGSHYAHPNTSCPTYNIEMEENKKEANLVVSLKDLMSEVTIM